MELLEGDANWITERCDILPAVATADPPNVIRQFRSHPSGAFLDDILAADGSRRVLLSEDMHLRDWARELYGLQSCWLQAVLLYLADRNYIDDRKLVECTGHLIGLGQA